MTTRIASIFLAILFGAATVSAQVRGRRGATATPRIQADPISRDLPAPRQDFFRYTALDTTWLGSWTFDGPNTVGDPQGWVSFDLSINPLDGIFFHVDDFAGLAGGDFGRLVPMEGAQSWF